jgi:hypothetical protein
VGGKLFSFALPMLQWIRAIPLDCLESCETCVCLCVSFHKKKKNSRNSWSKKTWRIMTVAYLFCRLSSS